MTFSFKNMKRSHVAKFGEYGGRSNNYICRGGGQKSSLITSHYFFQMTEFFQH